MKEEMVISKYQKLTQDGSNSSDSRVNSSSMRRVKQSMYQVEEIEKTTTFKFGYLTRLQPNNGILFMPMR